MGKAFYDRFEESRELYKRAATHLGYDLAALCFEEAPADLARTEKSQPALFVTALAAYTALRIAAPGLTPVGMAGLSLGELTALAAAEAMRFTDGLYLVQARGALMAECAAQSKGTMLAVLGLNQALIQEVCRESGAWAANYNSPDQLVLSGTVEAIAKAEAVAKAKGAKRSLKLDVAGAFHSPLMQPAAEKFKDVLAKVTFSAPRAPVITNVTGQAVPDAADIPQLLVKQIVSPVLWDPSVRTLAALGATHTVEFPPARILTGLVRKIDANLTGVAVNQPADFEKLAGLTSS